MTEPPDKISLKGFRKAYEQLRKAILDRTPLPPPGALVTDQPGQGRMITPGVGKEGTPDYPYKVYPNGAGLVSVVFGSHTFQDTVLIAELDGTSIDTIPAPTLAVSGTQFIYAKLTTDIDFEVDEFVIDAFASLQTDDDPNSDGTEGTFYDLIAEVQVDGSSITILPNINNSRLFKYCGTMLKGY